MKAEDMIITRLPTLVNTDKMGVKELREQYKLLEGDAISQAQQLSDALAQLVRTNKIVQDYNITFASLCDFYESGDQAALLLLVKKLSELRTDHNEKRKARVH